MELMLEEKWEDFTKTAKECKDGIILFGASSCADIFLNRLKETFPVKYIIDNDTQKQYNKFCGKYDVYPAEKLKNNTPEDIVLITSSYCDEIIAQLKELGISGKIYSYFHLRNKLVKTEVDTDIEENIQLLKQICADEKSRHIIDTIVYKRKNGIRDYSDIYEDNQYFVKDIMEPDENEVFIDGGAFDGETVEKLIEFEQNKFKKIYAFEMDRSNFEKIPQDKFDDRVVFCNYGLWDANQKISFIENGSGSEIAEDGVSSAECIALDSFMKEKVTFIKMDIEGAEQQALAGAKNIITKDKPKLAICLYHKPEDLWEIPFYIHKLVPEYKIYIRHHSYIDMETVMYACI